MRIEEDTKAQEAIYRNSPGDEAGSYTTQTHQGTQSDHIAPDCSYSHSILLITTICIQLHSIVPTGTHSNSTASDQTQLHLPVDAISLQTVYFIALCFRHQTWLYC